MELLELPKLPGNLAAVKAALEEHQIDPQTVWTLADNDIVWQRFLQSVADNGQGVLWQGDNAIGVDEQHEEYFLHVIWIFTICAKWSDVMKSLPNEKIGGLFLPISFGAEPATVFTELKAISMFLRYLVAAGNEYQMIPMTLFEPNTFHDLNALVQIFSHKPLPNTGEIEQVLCSDLFSLQQGDLNLLAILCALRDPAFGELSTKYQNTNRQLLELLRAWREALGPSSPALADFDVVCDVMNNILTHGATNKQSCLCQFFPPDMAGTKHETLLRDILTGSKLTTEDFVLWIEEYGRTENARRDNQLKDESLKQKLLESLKIPGQDRELFQNAKDLSSCIRGRVPLKMIPVYTGHPGKYIWENRKIDKQMAGWSHSLQAVLNDLSFVEERLRHGQNPFLCLIELLEAEKVCVVQHQDSERRKSTIHVLPERPDGSLFIMNNSSSISLRLESGGRITLIPLALPLKARYLLLENKDARNFLAGQEEKESEKQLTSVVVAFESEIAYFDSKLYTDSKRRALPWQELVHLSKFNDLLLPVPKSELRQETKLRYSRIDGYVEECGSWFTTTILPMAANPCLVNDVEGISLAVAIRMEKLEMKEMELLLDGLCEKVTTSASETKHRLKVSVPVLVEALIAKSSLIWPDQSFTLHDNDLSVPCGPVPVDTGPPPSSLSKLPYHFPSDRWHEYVASKLAIDAETSAAEIGRSSKQDSISSIKLREHRDVLSELPFMLGESGRRAPFDDVRDILKVLYYGSVQTASFVIHEDGLAILKTCISEFVKSPLHLFVVDANNVDGTLRMIESLYPDRGWTGWRLILLNIQRGLAPLELKRLLTMLQKPGIASFLVYDAILVSSLQNIQPVHKLSSWLGMNGQQQLTVSSTPVLLTRLAPESGDLVISMDATEGGIGAFIVHVENLFASSELLPNVSSDLLTLSSFSTTWSYDLDAFLFPRPDEERFMNVSVAHPSGLSSSISVAVLVGASSSTLKAKLDELRAEVNPMCILNAQERFLEGDSSNTSAEYLQNAEKLLQLVVLNANLLSTSMRQRLLDDVMLRVRTEGLSARIVFVETARNPAYSDLILHLHDTQTTLSVNWIRSLVSHNLVSSREPAERKNFAYILACLQAVLALLECPVAFDAAIEDQKRTRLIEELSNHCDFDQCRSIEAQLLAVTHTLSTMGNLSIRHATELCMFIVGCIQLAITNPARLPNAAEKRPLMIVCEMAVLAVHFFPAQDISVARLLCFSDFLTHWPLQPVASHHLRVAAFVRYLYGTLPPPAQTGLADVSKFADNQAWPLNRFRTTTSLRDDGLAMSTDIDFCVWLIPNLLHSTIIGGSIRHLASLRLGCAYLLDACVSKAIPDSSEDILRIAGVPKTLHYNTLQDQWFSFPFGLDTLIKMIEYGTDGLLYLLSISHQSMYQLVSQTADFMRLHPDTRARLVKQVGCLDKILARDKAGFDGFPFLATPLCLLKWNLRLCGSTEVLDAFEFNGQDLETLLQAKVFRIDKAVCALGPEIAQILLALDSHTNLKQIQDITLKDALDTFSQPVLLGKYWSESLCQVLRHGSNASPLLLSTLIGNHFLVEKGLVANLQSLESSKSVFRWRFTKSALTLVVSCLAERSLHHVAAILACNYFEDPHESLQSVISVANGLPLVASRIHFLDHCTTWFLTFYPDVDFTAKIIENEKGTVSFEQHLLDALFRLHSALRLSAPLTETQLLRCDYSCLLGEQPIFKLWPDNATLSEMDTCPVVVALFANLGWNLQETVESERFTPVFHNLREVYGENGSNDAAVILDKIAGFCAVWLRDLNVCHDNGSLAVIHSLSLASTILWLLYPDSSFCPPLWLLICDLLERDTLLPERHSILPVLKQQFSVLVRLARHSSLGFEMFSTTAGELARAIYLPPSADPTVLRELELVMSENEHARIPLFQKVALSSFPHTNTFAYTFLPATKFSQSPILSLVAQSSFKIFQQSWRTTRRPTLNSPESCMAILKSSVPVTDRGLAPNLLSENLTSLVYALAILFKAASVGQAVDDSLWGYKAVYTTAVNHVAICRIWLAACGISLSDLHELQFPKCLSRAVDVVTWSSLKEAANDMWSRIDAELNARLQEVVFNDHVFIWPTLQLGVDSTDDKSQLFENGVSAFVYTLGRLFCFSTTHAVKALMKISFATYGTKQRTERFDELMPMAIREALQFSSKDNFADEINAFKFSAVLMEICQALHVDLAQHISDMFSGVDKVGNPIFCARLFEQLHKVVDPASHHAFGPVMRRLNVRGAAAAAEEKALIHFNWDFELPSGDVDVDSEHNELQRDLFSRLAGAPESSFACKEAGPALLSHNSSIVLDHVVEGLRPVPVRFSDDQSGMSGSGNTLGSHKSIQNAVLHDLLRDGNVILYARELFALEEAESNDMRLAGMLRVRDGHECYLMLHRYNIIVRDTDGGNIMQPLVCDFTHVTFSADVSGYATSKDDVLLSFPSFREAWMYIDRTIGPRSLILYKKQCSLFRPSNEGRCWAGVSFADQLTSNNKLQYIHDLVTLLGAGPKCFCPDPIAKIVKACVENSRSDRPVIKFVRWAVHQILTHGLSKADAEAYWNSDSDTTSCHNETSGFIVNREEPQPEASMDDAEEHDDGENDGLFDDEDYGDDYEEEGGDDQYNLILPMPEYPDYILPFPDNNNALDFPGFQEPESSHQLEPPRESTHMLLFNDLWKSFSSCIGCEAWLRYLFCDEGLFSLGPLGSFLNSDYNVDPDTNSKLIVRMVDGGSHRPFDEQMNDSSWYFCDLLRRRKDIELSYHRMAELPVAVILSMRTLNACFSVDTKQASTEEESRALDESHCPAPADSKKDYSNLVDWLLDVLSSPMLLRTKLLFLEIVTAGPNCVHRYGDQKDMPQDMLVCYTLLNCCPHQAMKKTLCHLIDTFVKLDNDAIRTFLARRDGRYGMVVCDSSVLQTFQTHALLQHALVELRYEQRDAGRDEAFFLRLIDSFSSDHHIVYVTGMHKADDIFLKWCCEYTHRWPWRFIYFEGLQIMFNFPEIRDRFRPLTFDSVLKAANLSYTKENVWTRAHEGYESSKTPPQMPKSEGVVAQWQKNVEEALMKKRSCVVLLTSPPGCGKTHLADRLIELTKSSESEVKFAKRFDCSDDRLVIYSLSHLLDEAFSDRTDTSLLIADEFHLLNTNQKAELFAWFSTKLGHLRVLLIGNRILREDERLMDRLKKEQQSSSSIVNGEDSVEVSTLVEIKWLKVQLTPFTLTDICFGRFSARPIIQKHKDDVSRFLRRWYGSVYALLGPEYLSLRDAFDLVNTLSLSVEWLNLNNTTEISNRLSTQLYQRLQRSMPLMNVVLAKAMTHEFITSKCWTEVGAANYLLNCSTLLGCLCSCAVLYGGALTPENIDQSVVFLEFSRSAFSQKLTPNDRVRSWISGLPFLTADAIILPGPHFWVDQDPLPLVFESEPVEWAAHVGLHRDEASHLAVGQVGIKSLRRLRYFAVHHQPLNWCDVQEHWRKVPDSNVKEYEELLQDCPNKLLCLQALCGNLRSSEQVTSSSHTNHFCTLAERSAERDIHGIGKLAEEMFVSHSLHQALSERQACLLGDLEKNVYATPARIPLLYTIWRHLLGNCERGDHKIDVEHPTALLAQTLLWASDCGFINTYYSVHDLPRSKDGDSGNDHVNAVRDKVGKAYVAFCNHVARHLWEQAPAKSSDPAQCAEILYQVCSHGVFANMLAPPSTTWDRKLDPRVLLCLAQSKSASALSVLKLPYLCALALLYAAEQESRTCEESVLEMLCGENLVLTHFRGWEDAVRHAGQPVFYAIRSAMQRSHLGAKAPKTSFQTMSDFFDRFI